MNHLDDIIETVKLKGKCDVPLLSLYGLYFRGDDWRESMNAWAAQNSLKYSITPPDYHAVPDSQRTVRFYGDTASASRTPR